MRKSKEHFRHEWKYLINRAEKQLTDLRLRECMQLDPHAGEGGYMIRSLYFDDYWNSAMEEKDAGVLMRKKYRIRIYNCSDKSIKLERKEKIRQLHIQRSCAADTAGSRMDPGWKYEFLLRSSYRLCREFYIECVCNMMHPRVIVDYEREPWIMDTGTVRLTMDMKCACCSGEAMIFLTAVCQRLMCWNLENLLWN